MNDYIITLNRLLTKQVTVIVVCDIMIEVL